VKHGVGQVAANVDERHDALAWLGVEGGRWRRAVAGWWAGLMLVRRPEGGRWRRVVPVGCGVGNIEPGMLWMASLGCRGPLRARVCSLLNITKTQQQQQ